MTAGSHHLHGSTFMNLHIHGLSLVGEVEGRSRALVSTVSAKAEGSVGSLGLGHAIIGILVLIGEVLLDDVVCLHVDLLVLVGLALVDLLHAAALLDEQSISVDGVGCVTSSLLVQVTDLEDVLKTIEGDLDDLVVGAAKEVTQGLDASLGNKVTDLIWLLEASTGGVADSPARLLTGLEITVRQQVDKRRNDVGVNHGLNLRGVTSSDVGNGPASLLSNTVLVRAQQRQQARQSTTVDDDLGLHVVTSNDVSYGAQSGGLNGGRSMHEQLHQAAGDAGLDNGLDLVVGAIGKVRDRPAGIDQDFVVQGVNELRQHRKGRLWRLATAKVAQSPSSIAQHAKLAAVAKESQQGLESTAAQNVVTALWAVTSNVTEGPDGLLPHIGFWAGEELDENGHGTSLDDNLSLCSASGGNVGQGPSSLKLNEGVRRSEELDESGNNTGLDDLFDGRVALFGQKLSKAGCSLNLQIDLVGEDALYHLRKILAQLPATYLGLGWGSIIITVGGGAQGSTRSVFACADASSLRQVLLALCLSNLDLLLLAATTKLIRLEGVLGLELGPAMLGDVSLSHGCDRLWFCFRGE
ncbi:hypothetical protein VP1G_10880 [Cytospora mali]|uniref:Uncharacterized protein n=1 Tax=Cytospora mali TaxID=578113 RepID=A0A194UYM1_CYTMA|nr:hypothetical protein VP1G_10880 [Valsa mali var. pyri (nom. inval.)]